jgi:hypothetical protein
MAGAGHQWRVRIGRLADKGQLVWLPQKRLALGAYLIACGIGGVKSSEGRVHFSFIRKPPI